MLAPYYCEATFDPATPARAIAIVHNGGAQTSSLYFRGFDLFGTTEARVRIRIRRYPTKATGGTANTAYSFLDGAPTPSAQILNGSVTWPVSTPNFDLVARVATRATGGSDVPRGNITDGAITIAPDHTLVLETLDEDPTGTYTFRVYWGELLPAIPHIASTVLPAGSAYTTPTYFEIPQNWSAVTFWVTYTAHASTLLGSRPKWRVSRNDGTNDYPIPLVEEVLDLSGSLVSLLEANIHERRWPSLISANTTVRFPVVAKFPPGTSRISLTLAEIGDTTNRGTVTVTLTGR